MNELHISECMLLPVLTVRDISGDLSCKSNSDVSLRSLHFTRYFCQSFIHAFVLSWKYVQDAASFKALIGRARLDWDQDTIIRIQKY